MHGRMRQLFWQISCHAFGTVISAQALTQKMGGTISIEVKKG